MVNLLQTKGIGALHKELPKACALTGSSDPCCRQSKIVCIPQSHLPLTTRKTGAAMPRPGLYKPVTWPASDMATTLNYGQAYVML